MPRDNRSAAAHRAICAVRRGERRASDAVAALRDEVQFQEHGGHRRLERGDEGVAARWKAIISRVSLWGPIPAAADRGW
jgi:hypothetical protein